jgi:hypothetical protein
MCLSCYNALYIYGGGGPLTPIFPILKNKLKKIFININLFYLNIDEVSIILPPNETFLIIQDLILDALVYQLILYIHRKVYQKPFISS